MAQLQTATTQIANYNVTVLNQGISNMMASVRANLPIEASSYVWLVDIVNQLANHNHQIRDLVGRDTFGNVGVYGGAGTYVTGTTSVSSQLAGTTNPGIAVSSQITASQVNSLVAAVNALRAAHNHPYADRTS